MTTNEQEAHTGDLDGVLTGHTKDIVMFDVPPPYQGARGLDEYRATWPGFFEWQTSGAVFEIESLEVTAGEDVAFAFALLKCGPAEEFPASKVRLRLTLGLRKEDGRWLVSHEHHSFPNEDSPAAESEVRALHQQWSELTTARDLDGLMDGIAEDVVSYELGGELQYVGKSAVREVCKEGLESSDASFSSPDLTVLTRGDLAVAWGLDQIDSERSRATRVFRRTETGWKLVHQHLSLPQS
jgi:ketosteroid isomerase-like protein